MAIITGQMAPGFSLFDSEKNRVQLQDYRGKNVLLLFYPLAFTSVCTEELCSVRDNIAFYDKVDAQVFGISVDSLYVLAKFKEEQQLNFPLLSDFNKEASESYDSIYTQWKFDMKGVTKRSAFVIDKQGVVQYAEVSEDTGDLPNFEAIERTLATLN